MRRTRHQCEQKLMGNSASAAAEACLAAGNCEDRVRPAKACGKTFKILFANVTSWSERAKAFILQQTGYQAIGVVEHRQIETATMRKELNEKGWVTYLQAALETSKGGASAGVAIMVRRHLNSQQMMQPDNQRWQVTHLRFQQRTVVVIAAYFQPGGLQQPVNTELIEDIVAYIRLVQTEYIIMADWNAEPQELAETGLGRRIQGQILFRGPAISTGSTLDYFMVSSQLVGVIFLQVLHEVPFRPHYAVFLEISATLMQTPVPQLTSVLRTVPCGPRMPWDSFREDNPSFQALVEYPQTCAQLLLDMGYAKWVKQAEAWLMSTAVGEVELGRGWFLQIKFQPRVEQRPPQQAWQQASLNFWSVVSRLVNDTLRLQHRDQPLLLGHSLRRLVERTHVMAQHWQEGFRRSFSLLGLQYALRMLLQLGEGTQMVVLRELQHIFRQQLKTWHAHLKQEAQKQITTLAQRHRYLKKDEQSAARL